ncbi:MAG: ATP-binding protein [Pseudomonadota bacterium]|nr:ATP-binding protein [Pseudomonadota bacterium]
MSVMQAGVRDAGDSRSRTALAAPGVGMAVVDLQRRWVEVNPALERLLGYPQAEMAGRATAEFTHPDDLERTREALDHLIAGRSDSLQTQKRYTHRDGRTVWTHVDVSVVRDAAGAPLHLLAQLREIGPERAAELILRSRAEDRSAALDEANRQLQLFADAVAHDLRAPLRSIESFSGLLAARHADALDDKARDYLARIRGAASRMSSLLSALSELSYVTRAELKPARVDLGLLVDWVGAELHESEPGREADIRVQPGLVGYGDERLLKLMLAHLIGNAWKFSRGCETVRIAVDGDCDATGLRIRLSDWGCGFDMRYCHKLFEPFQRLHGPDDGGGHGLGLSIAHRVVDRHGGSIRAESEPGGGCTIHLWLPAAPVAEVQ